MIRLTRTLKPQPPEPLRIDRFASLELDSTRHIARLDGQTGKVRLGSWMFYVPDLESKYFHARGGCTDCVHSTRPTEADIQEPGRRLGRYLSDEWQRALTTSTTSRLAEVWMVSARLWLAGLGPQPRGLCFVETFQRDGEPLGPTCGLLIKDVYRMPRKLRCRLAHIEAAGVRPDKIASCVRRQVRGYVVDTCSVVGCMPTGAEQEAQHLAALLSNSHSDTELKQELQRTLTPAR